MYIFFHDLVKSKSHTHNKFQTHEFSKIPRVSEAERTHHVKILILKAINKLSR